MCSTACSAVIMAIGILRLKHLAETVPDSRIDAPPVVDEYADMPDLAWMAWVFSGLGCAIVSLIRSVFPSSAVEFDISKPGQGTALLILSAVQALVGLGLGRGRWWMYRPLPIVLFGVCGMAGAGFVRNRHLDALILPRRRVLRRLLGLVLLLLRIPLAGAPDPGGPVRLGQRGHRRRGQHRRTVHRRSTRRPFGLEVAVPGGPGRPCGGSRSRR